jgi:hypothetical protein
MERNITRTTRTSIMLLLAIPLIYLMPAQAVLGNAEGAPIPPAIVTPKIDGQYTPVDQLQLTETGKQAVENDPTLKPKYEWGDSTEMQLPLYNATHALNTEFKPEWYVALKHDDKWLYAMIDAVSDAKVGEHTPTNDTRQEIIFWFDKFISEGTSYYIDFYFVSSRELRAGKIPNLKGNLPYYEVLPLGYYKQNFSIAESPSYLRESNHRSANSAMPHLIIEFTFNITVVKSKYSDTISWDLSAWDINKDWLRTGADLNHLGDQPVPEFQWETIALAGSLLATGFLVQLSRARSVGKENRRLTYRDAHERVSDS